MAAAEVKAVAAGGKASTHTSSDDDTSVESGPGRGKPLSALPSCVKMCADSLESAKCS